MNRLKRLIRAYEFGRSKGLYHTQKDLANLMEANRSTISRALNGDEKYLTNDFMYRFNSAIGNLINIDWLINGIGDITNPVLYQDSDTKNSFTENKHRKTSDTNYIAVPLVPHHAYGKFLNGCDDFQFNMDEWKKESFTVDKIVPGNYMAFEVKGDSMDNGSRRSFENGDIVLARELERESWKNGLNINEKSFWVIVCDKSILIKEVKEQNLETGEITCHSLSNSPEYSDFKLRLDNIKRLYCILQKKPKTVYY